MIQPVYVLGFIIQAKNCPPALHLLLLPLEASPRQGLGFNGQDLKGGEVLLQRRCFHSHIADIASSFAHRCVDWDSGCYA